MSGSRFTKETHFGHNPADQRLFSNCIYFSCWTDRSKGRVKQIRTEKGIAFTQDQISNLYAPLLGIRYSIRAKSELRVEIGNAANVAWKQMCDRHEGQTNWYTGKEYEPYGKIIEYDNKQLTSELLPAYREMLRIFTSNLGFADPKTREYYPELSRFIELWDRWIEHTIPAEVMEMLNHTEENLHPFYDHLEDKLDELKGNIPKG